MMADEAREGLLRSSLDKRPFDTVVDITTSSPKGTHPIPPTARRQTPRQRVGRLALVIAGVFLLLLTSGRIHTRSDTDWDAPEPPYGQSPPWYPAPPGGIRTRWAESYEKAAKLVSRMNLPEKVNITTGTGWGMGPAIGNTGPALGVGFPSLTLQDGPLGLRHCDNITAFPAGVTVGATWSKELMYERGKAHAIEARKKGVHGILGPAVGPLGRMPAGGRGWETFGADPYLQGVAGAETVKGIQDQRIMATIKHFVGNEQEHFRQGWEWDSPFSISSNIDDRALHEIYAWPFADAIKEGVVSVMCSYNQVNNSYSCDNSKLINGILKDEMGFQGFVMSDWIAQRAGVASALSGLDMNMPGDGLFWADGKSLWGGELSKAVLNGSVPVDRLNDMVTRIVAAWYQLGQDKDDFDNSGPNFHTYSDKRYDVAAPWSPTDQDIVEVNKFINVQDDHNEVALQVATEGTVLLKNNGILPLSRDGSSPSGKITHIGIYGDDAGPGKGPNFCPDRRCNEGTLGSGWGSGAVDFTYLVSPIQALRSEFSSDIILTEHLSNDIHSSSSSSVIEALKRQDLCIVFGNADSGEGYNEASGVHGDRDDLFLHKGGEDLVKDVASNCGGQTIVVIHSVGAVVVDQWIDIPGVAAVLAAHLPGEESGNALASLLFGDVNPSGKLPYTIGKSLADYGEAGQVLYESNAPAPQQDFKEGLYIDYRHFDKYDITPRYEFGFGLSYTTFDYTSIKITEKKAKSPVVGERPPPDTTPPTYDTTIPPVEEAIYPPEIRRLERYVYPYIESASDITYGEYPYPEGYNITQPPSPAGGGEGGHPELWDVHLTVTVKITNTGSRGGKVVPQLYLSYPIESEATKDGVDFPVRVLRGFEKVWVEAGEETKISFDLTRRDVSYWDVVRQNWVMLVEGEYLISVGESSRDLRVQAKW